MTSEVPAERSPTENDHGLLTTVSWLDTVNNFVSVNCKESRRRCVPGLALVISPIVLAETMARMSGERGNRLARIGAGLLRGRWFVRAQWFRNVEAKPQVRVYLASHAPGPPCRLFPRGREGHCAVDAEEHIAVRKPLRGRMIGQPWIGHVGRKLQS